MIVKHAINYVCLQIKYVQITAGADGKHEIYLNKVKKIKIIFFNFNFQGFLESKKLICK